MTETHSCEVDRPNFTPEGPNEENSGGSEEHK